MNPQESRKRIHELVDSLPEDELPTVRRILEGLQSLSDPILRALLKASEEGRALSDEERAALREAESDLRRGAVRPLEEYLAEREE